VQPQGKLTKKEKNHNSMPGKVEHGGQGCLIPSNESTAMATLNMVILVDGHVARDQTLRQPNDCPFLPSKTFIE